MVDRMSQAAADAAEGRVARNKMRSDMERVLRESGALALVSRESLLERLVEVAAQYAYATGLFMIRAAAEERERLEK